MVVQSAVFECKIFNVRNGTVLTVKLLCVAAAGKMVCMHAAAGKNNMPALARCQSIRRIQKQQFC